MTNPHIYFGDSEPEDAWSPEDTVPEMIRNLFVRCALLDHGPRFPHGDGDTMAVLQELANRVLVRLKQRNLDNFDRNRGEMILEDIELIRSRIGD